MTHIVYHMAFYVLCVLKLLNLLLAPFNKSHIFFIYLTPLCLVDSAVVYLNS